MNLKKYAVSILAVLMSVCAFAYPSPQEEEPVTSLLQQYATQVQELQKNFDTQLLPTLKSLAGIALQVQKQQIPYQEDMVQVLYNQLDSTLNDLMAPALQGLDVNAFNKQYKQMAQEYGMLEQEFTKQDIADMFKGMYLISALGYFEQTQKLSTEELTVLMEIFFSQEEGTEEN